MKKLLKLPVARFSTFNGYFLMSVSYTHLDVYKRQILGSVRGNAFAGAGGDSGCFIFALDMKPIQLQIGDFIAKSPDKEKEKKRFLKRERTDGSGAPQVALVRDGNICIEPMTKGFLDTL